MASERYFRFPARSTSRCNSRDRHPPRRHAAASEVRLRITVTTSTLDLLIADNGRGIQRKPGDTLADGLRNMRQRAEELNAQFAIESAPGAGTKIFVRYFWPSYN